MAKDTEKLIRQLSLISFLMAERRPVTAPEIRQAVEGYSGMNEDAFARRFYADRAELESLGINLTVDKPLEGAGRAGELHPAARRTSTSPRSSSRTPSSPRCRPRCRCSTASSPTPSRCASPSSSSPGDGRARCARPTRHRSRWASPPRPAGHDLSQRLVKIETAISGARRSPSTTTRWSATRSASARSTPTSCSSRAASSTSSGAPTSATRCASSASRASAGRWPTPRRPSTTSSAPRTSTRASTRTASPGSSATPWATAEVRIAERIAWQVERHFGRYGRFDDEGDRFVTDYANPRQLVSWVLGNRRARPARRPDRARRRS